MQIWHQHEIGHFWPPLPHVSICQHCPNPPPNDDVSIRPSIFILSVLIVLIMHCLFNLSKWPVTSTIQMWFYKSNLKAIFEYCGIHIEEVTKFIVWVYKSLYMTSHKTLKMKRVKCDADVSILDDLRAPPLVIIWQHWPDPPFYADVIFAVLHSP